jgi:large subunit ribosomal protein L23
MKLPFAPLISEKTLDQTAKNRYTFKVDKKINKPTIKRLLEKFYRIEIEKINLLNQKGKKQRVRIARRPIQRWGKRQDYKKVIIWLKKGQKIKDFEIDTSIKNETTDKDSKDKKNRQKTSSNNSQITVKTKK